MIYFNYDIHLRATVTFTAIYWEMNWKNLQVSISITVSE